MLPAGLIRALGGCLESYGQKVHHRLVIIFELIGRIENIETIAIGGKIHDVSRLQKMYGKGRWRKLKGVGRIRLADGSESNAELHWYEAHGIGKKEMKVKQLFD
jgi:hypothetical protein